MNNMCMYIFRNLRTVFSVVSTTLYCADSIGFATGLPSGTSIHPSTVWIIFVRQRLLHRGGFLSAGARRRVIRSPRRSDGALYNIIHHAVRVIQIQIRVYKYTVRYTGVDVGIRKRVLRFAARGVQVYTRIRSLEISTSGGNRRREENCVPDVIRDLPTTWHTIVKINNAHLASKYEFARSGGNYIIII